ncbi:hypothetical protein HAX54_022433 [Datura stramonium]|uniref:Uncharacterized protein n=1 Tax=Datura stramonium TaxID=4076 RepID=A0ABS8UWP6_DATST|nr:hypothetical protein [Datura stramonium]
MIIAIGLNDMVEFKEVGSVNQTSENMQGGFLNHESYLYPHAYKAKLAWKLRLVMTRDDDLLDRLQRICKVDSSITSHRMTPGKKRRTVMMIHDEKFIEVENDPL